MLLDFPLIDTIVDTKKMFVPMTIRIVMRNYINKEGLSPLYLHVCQRANRKRIPLDIYINPKFWVASSQSLRGPNDLVYDDNIIIDDIKTKINNIKKTYRLSSRELSIDTFIDEFKNEMPRANFIAFYKKVLDIKKREWSPATYRKELSIFNKLKDYKAEIFFFDITQEFFLKYRGHLASLGNNKTTRNGNIKRIKKYLKYATKIGVKLQIDLDDIKSGSTKGNRDYLNTKEVETCYKYFNTEWINPSHKLVLAYFLFSCFTGLRISDVKQIERRYIKNKKYTLKNVKGEKTQVINLNEKALHVIYKEERLFQKFYSEKHINDTLKTIMSLLGVNKHVTFHVARHTFATNLIILGCPITEVQKLLNHSDIKDTMIYVHMAEQETNRNSDLLNNWF